MLKSLPVPFIIDHMGRVPTKNGLAQEPFRLLLDLARNNDKCWIKISGSERISSAGPPFADAVPFAQALIEAASDRILWGTDWPHPNIAKHMPNDGDLVDLIPLMSRTLQCRSASWWTIRIDSTNSQLKRLETHDQDPTARNGG